MNQKQLKVLFVCDDNSLLSQMAEGFFKSFSRQETVFSAGFKPASTIDPNLGPVMLEDMIDVTQYSPKLISCFQEQSFDLIVFLTDNIAQSESDILKKEKITGFKKEIIAISQEINAENRFEGTRNIRDEIKNETFKLFKKYFQSKPLV